MLHYCTSQGNDTPAVRLVLIMQINQACVAIKPWRCWATPGQKEILDAHPFSDLTYQNVLIPHQIGRSSSLPSHTRDTDFHHPQCIVRGGSILQEQEHSSRHEPNPKQLPKAKSSYLWPSLQLPPREKHDIRAIWGPTEVTGLWRRPLAPTITIYTSVHPERCFGNITPHRSKSLRLSFQLSSDSPLKC